MTSGNPACGGVAGAGVFGGPVPGVKDQAAQPGLRRLRPGENVALTRVNNDRQKPGAMLCGS